MSITLFYFQGQHRNNLTVQNCTDLSKKHNNSAVNLESILNKLKKRGIYLFPHSGVKLHENPKKFKISALENLYHLFVNLEWNEAQNWNLLSFVRCILITIFMYFLYILLNTMYIVPNTSV